MVPKKEKDKKVNEDKVGIGKESTGKENIPVKYSDDDDGLKINEEKENKESKSEVTDRKDSSVKHERKEENNTQAETRGKRIKEAIEDHKNPQDGSNSDSTRSDVPGSTTESGSSTIERLISSLQMMDFMDLGSRLVEGIRENIIDITKLLSCKDEFILKEVTSMKSFYQTWVDKPNNVIYIHRNSEMFISFSSISEYYSEKLMTLMKRIDEALVILREPQNITLRTERICDPEALGFPMTGLLENGIYDENIIRRIESACKPRAVGVPYIELTCVGDKYILETNRNLITYCIDKMVVERNYRNRYLNTISLQTKTELKDLNKNSFQTYYYPSFSPFNLQGIFDKLVRSVDLRLTFNIPLIKHIVRWTPITQTDLVKISGLNVAKAGYISDIIQHNWKDEYATPLNVYDASWMHPGEILFDLQIPDNMDAFAVNGIAGLIGKLMFTYSENSNICNSTDQMQIELERHIIKFGIQTNSIVLIEDAADSKFPLSMYKLSRGGADRTRRFDWLKTRGGESGACANGNIYVVNDSLSEFFPNIARRQNYVIDLDDGSRIQDLPTHLARWKTYLGIVAFLETSSANTSYLNLMSVLATRIMQHFLRLNEYLKIRWYTMFRMSVTSSLTFKGEVLNRRAKIISITNNFIITASKGLDNTYLVAEADDLSIIRIQSAFVKESFVIDCCLRYMTTLWEQTGMLPSFPTTRRIEIVCNSSPIYKFIFGVLYRSNEIRKMRDILQKFRFTENSLAQCFSPLLTINPEVERMYGIVNSVYINCTMNWINKDLIIQCINTNSPLTNSTNINSDTNILTYRHIERLIRERRFVSTFFNSNEAPFLLNVKFPYEFSHVLSANTNEVALEKANNITSDVSYEHHIKNKKLKMLFVSIDRSNYIRDDDYVIGTHQIDEMFPLSSDVHDVIITAVSFFSSLGQRSTMIYALSKTDYHFQSLYEKKTTPK